MPVDNYLTLFLPSVQVNGFRKVKNGLYLTFSPYMGLSRLDFYGVIKKGKIKNRSKLLLNGLSFALPFNTVLPLIRLCSSFIDTPR